MGHYLSEMLPEDREFDRLYAEIERKQKALAKAPLKVFTVAEFFKIQELLERRWSRLHTDEFVKRGMRDMLKEIDRLLAKVG